MPFAAALAAVLLCLLALPAAAQRPAARPAAHPVAANAPKSIGKFEDWQAATHAEGDQTVCYAFTRATSSSPVLPGRGEVVLTVTERTTPRDAVAMSAGFTYPPGTTVQMQVDGATQPFYTDKRNAFARDGKALLAAFGRARTASARSPGPRNMTVVDNFSLRGFAPAYAAILKACPVK